jgi:hypothetical protein
MSTRKRKQPEQEKSEKELLREQTLKEMRDRIWIEEERFAEKWFEKWLILTFPDFPEGLDDKETKEAKDELREYWMKIEKERKEKVERLKNGELCYGEIEHFVNGKRYFDYTDHFDYIDFHPKGFDTNDNFLDKPF